MTTRSITGSSYLGQLPVSFRSIEADVRGRTAEWRESTSFKYYDAASPAAAECLGAPIFYTEDLNHDQLYGSVRAVNPFL